MARAKKGVSADIEPDLYERMVELMESRPGKVNKSHFVRQAVRERVERLEASEGRDWSYQERGWAGGEAPLATVNVSSDIPPDLYERTVELLNNYPGSPDMAPFIRKAIRERVNRLENRENTEVPPPGEFS